MADTLFINMVDDLTSTMNRARSVFPDIMRMVHDVVEWLIAIDGDGESAAVTAQPRRGHASAGTFAYVSATTSAASNSSRATVAGSCEA